MNIIFLIGPRASGKTRVGGLAAKQLGAEFADADKVFAENFGPIDAFVAKEGWEEFRKRESGILRALCAEEGGQKVIATGGGIVLSVANRDFMRAAGLVLYLAAPAELLAARLTLDPQNSQRPSLTGKSAAEEVAEVLARREPLYKECAHHILNASKAPEDVAADICEILRFGQ